MDSSFTSNAAPLYSDFGYLASLKGEAQNAEAVLGQGFEHEIGTIEKVANQFESLFVQMMLKSMREASKPTESGLFGSDQMDMYQDMFDQQVSLELSGQGGIGLADILVRQLGGDPPHRQNTAEASASAAGTLPSMASSIVSDSSSAPISDEYAELYSEVEEQIRAAQEISQEAEAPRKAQLAGGQSAADAGTVEDGREWQVSGPNEFVDRIWREAERIAAELNLAPDALVAQAALETGWGRQVIQRPDGSSSFNLFGIKAGSDWNGDSVVTQTLEFSDGLMLSESHAFRAYGSVTEAFEDYADFLNSSPRYTEVLASGDNKTLFAQSLEDSGYATDPDYAEKIIGIINRPQFQDLIQQKQGANLGQDSGAPLRLDLAQFSDEWISNPLGGAQ